MLVSDGALPLLTSPHGGQIPPCPLYLTAPSSLEEPAALHSWQAVHSVSRVATILLKPISGKAKAHLKHLILCKAMLLIGPTTTVDSRADVQYSHRVESAAGKGKKRSVKKESVQRERSSCGGEERRGDAPSHGVYSYKEA